MCSLRVRVWVGDLVLSDVCEASCVRVYVRVCMCVYVCVFVCVYADKVHTVQFVRI